MTSQTGGYKPPFEPTPQQRKMVSMASALNVSLEMMAKMVLNPATGKPIDIKTLRKHFERELEIGLAEAVFNVGVALYKNAIDGNLGAQCFFLKNRAGWRDRVESHTTVQMVDITKLTDEQLAILETVLPDTGEPNPAPSRGRDPTPTSH